MLDFFQQFAGLRIAALPTFVTAHPLDQIRRARGDVFADGFGAIEFELLREIAHAESASSRNFPGIGVARAGQNFQQTRLAAAVAADQPDFFAGRDRERDAFEQALITERQDQFVGGQQGRNMRTHDLNTAAGVAVNTRGSEA